MAKPYTGVSPIAVCCSSDSADVSAYAALNCMSPSACSAIADNALSHSLIVAIGVIICSDKPLFASLPALFLVMVAVVLVVLMTVGCVGCDDCVGFGVDCGDCVTVAVVGLGVGVGS